MKTQSGTKPAKTSGDSQFTMKILSPQEGAYANSLNYKTFTISGSCTVDGTKILLNTSAADSSTVSLGSTTCSNSAWSTDVDLTSAAEVAVKIYASGSIASSTKTTPVSLGIIKDTILPTTTLTTSAVVFNTSPIAMQLTFSEEVVGLTLSKFTTSNVSLGNLSGSGKSFTFNASPDSNGPFSISLSTGSVFDVAGNPNVTSSTFTQTFNNLSPTVVITSTAPSYTNVSPIPVTVTFSSAVTGFNSSKMTLANGTVSGFAGSGTTYTFNVTPSGQGVVSIDIAAGVVSEAAGNLNLAAAQFTRTYDTVAPTVVISSTAGASTNVSPIPITITFSEAVTGFTSAGVTVGGGSIAGFAGSGTTYTFNLVPSGQGAVTVDVAANGAQDATGNNNTVATQLTRTYDSVVPTVVISSTASTNTNVSPIPITVTFSESVTGFTSGKVTLGNATISGFAGSGTTYTFNATPSAQGAVTVDVAANAGQDAAGNNSTAATQITRTFDNVRPTATIALTSAAGSPTRLSPWTFSVTFSESVTGFSSAGVSVSNGALSAFAGSGTTYTFTVTPTATGTVTVDVPQNGAQDAATNQNTAASQYSRAYDITPPPNPTGLAVTAGDDQVSASWTTGGGDTAGYILVRRFDSAVTWTPTAGTVYTTGDVGDGLTMATYIGANTSYIELAVVPSTPSYYAVFAYDAAYNYSAASTANVTTLPMARFFNQPNWNSNPASLDIKIGGKNVTQYKYAILTGTLVTGSYDCANASYSGWTNVATHITDAMTSGGQKRLCVLGKTAGGATQIGATEYTWIQGQGIGISRPDRFGAKVVTNKNFQIRWKDFDATDDATTTMDFYYSATVTGVDCTGATAITTGVSQNTATKYYSWNTTSVPLGTYYICAAVTNGGGTKYVWSEGTVTINNICTGAYVTNPLTSNGSGTLGSPFIICTLTQLYSMTTDGDTRYYSLGDDIDATPTTSYNGGKGWRSIPSTFGTFMGTFDGNGYIINGLYINDNVNYYGKFFIRVSSSAVLKNIYLENISFTTNYGAMTALASAGTNVTISNCHVTGSMNATWILSGFISGANTSTTITDSSSSATLVTTTADANGLLNTATGLTMTNSWFDGTATTATQYGYLGGLTGNLDAASKIISSYSTATLSNTYGPGGGSTNAGLVGNISGSAPGLIRNSFFAGSISASSVAGVISTPDSTAVSSSYNLGAVTATVGGAGGVAVVALNSSRFIGTFSTGTIYSSSSSAVGLVGRLVSGYIAHSWSSGSISSAVIGNSDGNGGLVGNNFAWILSSFSTANVSGISNVGGLVGCRSSNTTTNIPTISNSYFAGNVTRNSTDNNYASGSIAGWNGVSNLTNSYSAGTVTGAQVGGLIGAISNNAYTFSNNFTVASITATGTAGNIVGWASSLNTFTNNYWYTAAGNPASCAGNTGGATITNCTSQGALSYFYNPANPPLSGWPTTEWTFSGSSLPILSWQAP